MLKKKLTRVPVDVVSSSDMTSKRLKSDVKEVPTNSMIASRIPRLLGSDKLSVYFKPPTWRHFYDLECCLNSELQQLQVPSNISYIYNPVDYASELHCAYLRRFLSGRKAVVFLGMNPGPNGMCQTGVPFGNVMTVRDEMQLSGEVQKPVKLHPKRSISGLLCKVEEPSGMRMWGLMKKLAGTLDIFSRHCFIHNFCPLAFFDSSGKNITPNELKNEYKTLVRDACLRTLEREMSIVKPKIIVAVGDYIYNVLKHSIQLSELIIHKLPHPSPRALNNQNWPEKAEELLDRFDLLTYIRNEE